MIYRILCYYQCQCCDEIRTKVVIPPGVADAESELCRTDSGQCSGYSQLCPVLRASLQLQEARDVPEGGGENHGDDVHSTGECGKNISEIQIVTDRYRVSLSFTWDGPL